MQQPKNTQRLLRALAKQGLDVSYDNPIYTVRLNHCADAPAAEVLLPPDFPIEGKAFQQLAQLTTLAHPGGGKVTRTFATPDFHPGDTGVAIGSVIQTQGMVVPAAVGSDINCGMRLHVVDLSIEDFLAQRDKFVELMKGDYLLGTRDVTMTAATSRAMFNDGIPGWLEQMSKTPLGSVTRSDFAQLWQEIDRVHFLGSMGTPSYLLSGLGNDRYLNSAAHGAGRAISRFELTRAGANYTESDLGLTEGVDCITLRPERRIEEAPAAYKSIDRVIDTQVAAGMVEVVAKMRPILTFKA